MTAKSTISRIKCLIGHKFNYQGETLLFLDWRVDGDQVQIETDGRQLKMHIAHCPEFLTELEAFNIAGEDALEGIESPQQSAALATQVANEVDKMLPTSALAEINNALLDSIRKLQTDPAYIPQAKAISNAVQVAVNVSKLQIEAAKVSLQAQRKSGR